MNKHIIRILKYRIQFPRFMATQFWRTIRESTELVLWQHTSVTRVSEGDQKYWFHFYCCFRIFIDGRERQYLWGWWKVAQYSGAVLLSVSWIKNNWDWPITGSLLMMILKHFHPEKLRDSDLSCCQMFSPFRDREYTCPVTEWHVNLGCTCPLHVSL